MPFESKAVLTSAASPVNAATPDALMTLLLAASMALRLAASMFSKVKKNWLKE